MVAVLVEHGEFMSQTSFNVFSSSSWHPQVMINYWEMWSSETLWQSEIGLKVTWGLEPQVSQDSYMGLHTNVWTIQRCLCLWSLSEITYSEMIFHVITTIRAVAADYVSVLPLRTGTLIFDREHELCAERVTGISAESFCRVYNTVRMEFTSSWWSLSASY